MLLPFVLCIQLVIASPWLRNDKLWKEFLKPKTGGSSDAPPTTSSGFSNPFKRDTSSSVPVVYDSDNVGENKLISCLHQLEVPYKFTLTQRMEEVRIEINTIEKFGKSHHLSNLRALCNYLTVVRSAAVFNDI